MKTMTMLMAALLSLIGIGAAHAEPLPAAYGARELLEAYQQDPAKQTPTYAGEIITVTGVVVYTGPDIHSTPSVELSDVAGGTSYVVAVLDSFDMLNAVSVGDTVTVSGSFHIVSSDAQVVLKHSQFVQQSAPTVRSFSYNKRFSCDVQVLSSDKGNILVDPGFYDGELREYVESIGGLDAILLTHGHWDNICSLDEAVAANPDAAVYMHVLDKDFLRDPVLNCSINNGFSLMLDTVPTFFTEEGMYDIAGYTMEVIHVPGHSIGSCIFHFAQENMLFTGDTFMTSLVGSAAHPTGSETDRAASIEKFKQLTFPNDMQIYCGHLGNTTYKDMMRTNVDLQ